MGFGSSPLINQLRIVQRETPNSSHMSESFNIFFFALPDQVVNAVTGKYGRDEGVAVGQVRDDHFQLSDCCRRYLNQGIRVHGAKYTLNV